MSTETADESSNEKRMRLQISPEKQSPRRSPAKSIDNIYFNRNSPTSPRHIGILFIIFYYFFLKGLSRNLSFQRR